MPAGRPRKPTAVKAAEGNRGRRKLNERELLEAPEAPAMPDWLDEVAREEWKKITALFLEMGVLRPIDQAEVASLCQAISTLRQARKQFDAMEADKRLLFKTSKGTIQANPLLWIINRQVELIHRIASEFGMTPASRSRLLTDDMPMAPTPQTLEELISGPAQHFADDPVN